MRAIRVSIEIDVTPEDLWTILEPVETHVEWMADAERITFTTEQTRGVGTEFVCVTKVGPITLDDRMAITEWEPNHRMGVRHDGIVSGSGVFTLEPIDFGRRTRFVWAETLTFPWYLGGRLGELIGVPIVLGAIWHRNLKRLKALAERST